MNDFANIYAYVQTVPPGRVVSYGEVGEQIGATARTVGWAMSEAPEAVPWQRVVGSDGYLRIASRSIHLKALQEKLLTDEGVQFDDKGRVLGRFFWLRGAEETP